MSLLCARNLTVTRQSRHEPLLDGISLTLTAGQCVAVIGPNGAGKSTLLASLAGLIAPSAGEILLDGTALSALAPSSLAQRRAYLAQGARAQWPVSVEYLVTLGLTPLLPAHGKLPKDLAGKVEQALCQMDLRDKREQAVTTLSGGELARAMLARALVADPEVLLVDEPLAGLDPLHSLATSQHLRRLADSGRLVVTAMHDLTLAARTATHCALLDKGRLIGFGPTQCVLTSQSISGLFGVKAQVTDAGTPQAEVSLRI